MDLRVHIVVAAALGALACTDREPAGPDAAPSLAELDIGSAEVDGTGFVHTEDGVDVLLVPGSQGGFHIWTGLRVAGATGEFRIVRSARRVRDDALILRASPFAVEVPADAEGGWEAHNAAPSFMCPSPLGVMVRDETIELVAELRSREDDALLATDTMRVTPRCPDGDHHAFCLEICSG